VVAAKGRRRQRRVSATSVESTDGWPATSDLKGLSTTHVKWDSGRAALIAVESGQVWMMSPRADILTSRMRTAG
jgi:hypothetical protein